MRFLIRAIVVAAALTLSPAVAMAADATLFRIFLNDGTAVTSYGEYARVGDQVVFSLPLNGTTEQPRLHIVTVRADAVDWTRTETAARSIRYQQYVSTRAEDDFRLLSNEVARVLNDIALTTDRQQALATAERARQTLASWPQTHYGYRQDEVREIVGLIDESIARLRGTTVPVGFQLALVASPVLDVQTPPAMPSPREAVDQLMHLSAATPRVDDRVAMLQSALALLVDPAAAVPDSGGLRQTIEQRLHEEAAIDDRYRRLSQRLVTAAATAAARASVRDVERVLDQIGSEDVRLGGQRPESVQSLRAAVEGHLDAARRLRLLRDQWVIRRTIYRDYQKAVQSQILQLVKAQPVLDAIRRLDGPEPARLMALRSRLSGGAERLARVKVLDDLRPAHEFLVNAWRFAEHAADVRYAAVTSANVTTAWEASSAAAGALMMLSRAQQEIRTLLDPPRLR